MRFLLVIKWLMIILFTAVAWVFAMPLFLVFMWSNRHDTQSYLKHMGGELHYDIREDFRRLRFKQSTVEDRHGFVWIAVSLLILTVVIYWRTHG